MRSALLLFNRVDMAVTFSDVFKVIAAIFLPPLGVCLEVGFTQDFWINVILTLLGWIPGVVHALFIIFSH
jgi:uncharacterized membrane protein YqaE (UPF0057 family)